MAEENCELTPRELKLFLLYARQFGVQNFNLQQEKAVAEFLSGSDVFVNLPTGYGKHYSSAEIELSKQHSHFPNESIVVCKIYPKKKV